MRSAGQLLLLCPGPPHDTRVTCRSRAPYRASLCGTSGRHARARRRWAARAAPTACASAACARNTGKKRQGKGAQIADRATHDARERRPGHTGSSSTRAANSSGLYDMAAARVPIHHLDIRHRRLVSGARISVEHARVAAVAIRVPKPEDCRAMYTARQRRAQVLHIKNNMH